MTPRETPKRASRNGHPSRHAGGARRSRHTSGDRAPTAREVVIEALLRVELDGAYLDRVLPVAFERAGLGPEDRGLATEIAYGVLRRERALDHLIAALVDRPLTKIDARTLLALRMGIFQILYLARVPAHAAVFETVEALKRRRPSAAGFVNANLRRFLDPARRPVMAPPSPLEALALACSSPPWLAAKLSETARAEGFDFNEVAATLLEPASPTLRALTRRTSRDALLDRLAATGADITPTPCAPHGVRVRRIGDVSKIEGFGNAFIAQDEAAQWVMTLVAGEQGSAFDACAAPGGKTVVLWDMGFSPLAAMDAKPSRVRLLRDTLARAGVEADVREGSAAAPPFSPAHFDVVVLDAPCTGSGTLRRHPEIKKRMQEGDPLRLAALQRELLDGVHGLVRPGGVLLYSVCSVFHEEGRDQIAAFVRDRPEFTLEETLATFAHLASMDGFFAARLRRKQ